MPDQTRISQAEWEVMRALWERNPLTAAQVIERLAPKKDWNPRTVKTLLNRLVRKGALAYEQEANRYLYRPRISREQSIRRESRSFLDRVFGGAAGPMLNYFAQTANLTADEIDELKRILKQRTGR